MPFVLFSLTVSALFFATSLVLLNFGRQSGLRYLKKNGTATIAGLGIIESAVFALIGLLVAFTVSGALQRFDERRQLVIQEANAISTAYDRLALFEDGTARNLQRTLRDYAHARVELYRMPLEFSVWDGTEVWSGTQYEKIRVLKNNIWHETVTACAPATFRPQCALATAALNGAFEAARNRAGAAEKHPPRIVYVMLFGLGLSGSLLAGFSMAAAKARSWTHMITFAGALTVTLFLITDIEFPRLGLINITSFDHFLADVHDQMQVDRTSGESALQSR